MLHADNERILTLMSQYLCFTPCAISRQDVLDLAASCDIPENDAYLALLAAHCDLDPLNPADTRLSRGYLPRMVRRLDPADYRTDAYYQTVRPAAGSAGSITLCEETVTPMELFVADDFEVDSVGRVLPQLGWFPESFSFPAILEDGRVWMTVTPNEINTIRPAIEQSHGKVLTYGLGLGYYAFHALCRPDVTQVTVVEQNPHVIDVFRRLLLPFFPRPQHLRIIQGDAFAYARDVAPSEGYDVVFTDLWHDVADGLPMYRQMKALETPGPRYLYWIEKTLRCYMDED